MTPLQYRMLELVLEIDAICKKHQIPYYLAGGSVLGAVRHKGFIPWDDDIDIMMTRQAFAVFQAACETDMREDREIITMMNTPCHTKVTIKYMNKSTCQFFRSQVLDTTGCGISLDIMILDPLPRDPEEKAQHIAEYVVYNELLTPFFTVNKNHLHKHVPLYCQWQKRARHIGREAVMQELYTRLFVDEPAESDQYLYRWGQMLLIYDRALFGTPRYMEFEGYRLPVPERTVDFLRATYGDHWVYLPEVQERETHVSFLDTNLAYANWLRDIRPQIADKPARRVFSTRKALNVKRTVLRHKAEVREARDLALLMEMEWAHPSYAPEALAQLEDAALLNKVQGYIRLQTDKIFRQNGIVIAIPDAALALVGAALVRTGDTVRADRLLACRRSAPQPLGEALMALEETLATVCGFVRYFEDRYVNEGDVRDIRLVAPELLAACRQYPRHLPLLRCLLQLHLVMGDALPGGLTAAEEATAAYPEDTELAYWAGCLYEQAGLTHRAEAAFARSAGTSHGIVLQERNKRLHKGA